ncbi:MAG: ChbG/HpnK family deacetylase [Rhizobium sp.]|nr:ChbG/HpnK family deacetylase [Rhizobium sp.]
MKLLIVNADDFGLNAAANAGIIACHQAGSVTSTTLMANAPGFDEAVALARANPALGVGLHFNLTWGEPLAGAAQVPSLVGEDGRLLSREPLGRRALLGRLVPAELRRELDAQFDRLQDHGIAASHVDSHQHVHAFGPVFAAVAMHCQARSLPMRVPWVAADRQSSPARRLRRAVLSALLSRATRRWQGRVRWNDSLGSVFELGEAGARLEDAHYRQLLARATGPVHELMVHPVTSAEAMQGYTRVGPVAEAEYHYLRQGRLAALAAEAGYRLGNYRELRR